MINEQTKAAARLAGEWWAERLIQGDRERFAAAVTQLICEEFERGERIRGDGCLMIAVDYDPDRLLCAALEQIGIECRGFLFSARGILPQKHYLKVYPDRLEPKEGYGNWTAAIPVTVAREGSGS